MRDIRSFSVENPMLTDLLHILPLNSGHSTLKDVRLTLWPHAQGSQLRSNRSHKRGGSDRLCALRRQYHDPQAKRLHRACSTSEEDPDHYSDLPQNVSSQPSAESVNCELLDCSPHLVGMRRPDVDGAGAIVTGTDVPRRGGGLGLGVLPSDSLSTGVSELRRYGYGIGIGRTGAWLWTRERDAAAVLRTAAGVTAGVSSGCSKSRSAEYSRYRGSGKACPCVAAVDTWGVDAEYVSGGCEGAPAERDMEIRGAAGVVTERIVALRRRGRVGEVERVDEGPEGTHAAASRG